jgi:hypothetical protein
MGKKLLEWHVDIVPSVILYHLSHRIERVTPVERKVSLDFDPLDLAP